MAPRQCDEDQVAKCSRELGEINATLKGVSGQLESLWQEIQAVRAMREEFARYKGGIAVIAGMWGAISAAATSIIVAWFKRT